MPINVGRCLFFFFPLSISAIAARGDYRFIAWNRTRRNLLQFLCSFWGKGQSKTAADLVRGAPVTKRARKVVHTVSQDKDDTSLTLQMLSSEMHLLKSYIKAMDRIWCKVDISPISDLATTAAQKKSISQINHSLSPFLSPDLPLFNSEQKIFVILTLIVEAILILNNTMLARPEFWLKQTT